MAVNRPGAQRDADRAEIARLYLRRRSLTQARIALEMNRRRDAERQAENARIGQDNVALLARNRDRLAQGLDPLPLTPLLPFPDKTMHISQQTVSNDLAALRAEWRGRAVRDTAEIVAEQLEEIELLRSTYYEAWEESRGESVTTHSERYTEEPTGPHDLSVLADDKNLEGAAAGALFPASQERRDALRARLAAAGKVRTKATYTSKTLAGESAFLQGVQSCLSERGKLLGLYKQPEGGSANVTITFADLATLAQDGGSESPDDTHAGHCPADAGGGPPGP